MKHSLTFFSFLLISSHVLSNTRTLTLNETIDLAFERNERSKISEEETKKAEFAIKKIKSNLYPIINLDGQLVKSRTKPVMMPFPGIDKPEESFKQIGTISLTQPIYTFGRLGGAIRLAKYQDAITKEIKLASDASVRSAAKSLFYSALFYENLVKITEESYTNAKNNKLALQKRVSFGRIGQNDNLKMEADIASRKPSLIEANKLLDSSLLALREFLNLEDDIKVQGNLSDIKLAKKEENLKLEDLASIKVLQGKLNMQSAQEEIAKSDYWPTLSFFASYSDAATFESFQKNNYYNQENIAFGINLNLKINFGGEKIHESEIKKVETRIKRLEYEEGKRKIETTLNDLSNQLEKLKEEYEASKVAKNLAENSYKVSLNSFSTGNISQTQLNDSELLLTNNKINTARILLQMNLISFKIEELQTKGF